MIQRKKSLQKILKETLTLRGKFDVFDKLYHPNPAFRSEAIKYLTNNFANLRDGEQEMIKTSVLDRLNDNNVNVVKETLSLIKKIPILHTESLRQSLIQLLTKYPSMGKQHLDFFDEVALMLCEISEPEHLDSFNAIFVKLLPKQQKQFAVAKKLIETQFIQKSVILKLKSDLSFQKKPNEFCDNILNSLCNNNLKLVGDFVSAITKTPVQQLSSLYKYIAMLILSHILPKESPIEITSEVVEIFIIYYKSTNKRSDKGKLAYQQHIKRARKGLFPTDGFLSCLRSIIYKTKKPQSDIGKLDLSQNAPFERYFVLLTDLLLQKHELFKKYAKDFLDYFCGGLVTTTCFLLNVAQSGNEALSADGKLACVSSVLEILTDNTQSDIDSAINETLVPLLLVFILDESKVIREVAIDIVALLSQTNEGLYTRVLKKLVEQKEELVLDEEQLPLIIFNVLTSNSDNKVVLAELSRVLNSLVEAVCNDKNPIYLKAALLKLLSHINNVDIFQKTSKLAFDILRLNVSLNKTQSGIVRANILRLDPSIARNIKLNSNIWNLIETAIKSDTITMTSDNLTTCPCVLVLNQLDKEFCRNLPNEIAEELLNLIIGQVTIAQNLDVQPAASHLFKHIDLDAKLILQHFIKMRDVQSPKLDLNKLKRRISVVPTIDILDTLEWRKGVAILEFIQDKKKITNIELILPLLFEILKKCLDFDEQAAVEYPKQLLLSSILHFCAKLEENQAVKEESFNIETIVQCIRASQNPQTHHHALLVLAHLAQVIPAQVLHHIMAIFTFMGSSVLRHDDSYSYQIIAKIIDTVIPILIQDNEKETIAKVLRVFVDVLLDVPEHRRVPLYKQLLENVGVKDNLYVFLLLVFEAHTIHGSVKGKNEDPMRRLDIATTFCHQFPPDSVIHTCIELVKFLKMIPDEFDNEKFTSFLNIQFKTPKQFRHFKYTLVTFIANLLSSKQFVNQVAELTNESVLALETLFKDMVIGILTFIQRISKVAQKNENGPQAQYWKILLHHSYDILDGVNALLTPQMFLLVIKGLMLHSLPTVRRRALELLNSKLQHNIVFFQEECDSEEIFNIVPPIIGIIRNLNEEDNDEVIVQTALLSLKLLVRILAPKYPEKFSDILDLITDLIKSKVAEGNVLASLILCLAEMCVNMRARAISNLPNFMPSLLKVIRSEKQQLGPSLLLLASVTALLKIIDTLPLFLSPYLEKLLCELSMLSSRFQNDTTEDKAVPVVNKLTVLKEKIGDLIPPRVLIPAIEQSYGKLIERKCYSAIGPLMDMLGKNLDNLKSPDINQNLPELTNFFLNALQFRSGNDINLEDANLIEDQIIKALVKLILKLSESHFRPLYYKLFDWAIRSEVKTERVITFYALSSCIAQSLKGLFVLFAGHFLNNAAQILDSCNTVKNQEGYYLDKEGSNTLLLENVLKTLLYVFSFDNQKFINRDRFEVLMQPLVDQLENTLGGIEKLEMRNEQLVTPCIVHFAVATADDALWKQLNYQILLKMRHTLPNIRLVALNCLTEIVKKLGEDFLPLLPETIPFLAELLEDEEEHVEKACKTAVHEMERVLGENLQKYF